MSLHIPTVFVLMIALNAVLAISFAVAATGSQRDLRLWAVALAFNWLGYVALAVRPAGWEWLAILITNLAFAIMMSLYIHGVDRIRGHHQARANLVWPVIMVGLLALLVSDYQSRVILISVVMLIQSSMLLRSTVLYRKQRADRGQLLLMSGAILWGLTLLIRTGAEWFGFGASASVEDPTWPQEAIYLASLSATVLLSLSVPMMLRERSEAALGASERHYRRLIESADEGVIIVSGLRFRYVNPAACVLLGDSAEHLLGQPYLERIHPDDRALSQSVHQQRLEGKADHQSYEVRVLQPNGQQRWVRVSGVKYDWQGQPASLAFLSDITAQVEQHQAERELAFVDPLTGLDNRRRILERLTDVLSAARKSNQYTAVLFLDLDNFKPLNDSAGHWAGDQLLIEVARRLRQQLRSSDGLGRLGGDEFVVVLTHLGEDSDAAWTRVRPIANSLLEALREPYQIQYPEASATESTPAVSLAPITHHCSASIGLALSKPGEIDAQALIDRADQAMYRAKEHGRNQVSA